MPRRPPPPDLPDDWGCEFDAHGRVIPEPADTLLDEPVVKAARLNGAGAYTPPEARRQAAKVMRTRAAVVRSQRAAAVVGDITHRGLAAQLAAEAGDLWDAAAYIRKHRREMPDYRPRPSRRGSAAPPAPEPQPAMF